MSTERVPRPPLPLSESPILLPEGRVELDEHGNVIGTAIRQCKDNVHVFADLLGECQCGQEVWPPPSHAASNAGEARSA